MAGEMLSGHFYLEPSDFKSELSQFFVQSLAWLIGMKINSC